jgi:hypothetical protein
VSGYSEVKCPDHPGVKKDIRTIVVIPLAIAQIENFDHVNTLSGFIEYFTATPLF